ncbi:glycosyltransferase family 4 protein [Halomarina halobia]|uniref:Glycosyltransferase family 4 protein n=1 Tax=Halomarina halobia TaxID=3033386 RepID=A0ABD6A987_9EURY
MPRVALLHARPDFATALATTVERVRPEFEVDVYTDSASVPARVARLLRRRYDLVQADELVGNGVLAALLSERRGVPLVAAVRGWADYTNDHGQYSLPKAWWLARRAQWVLDRADAAVFVSEVCREMMRRRYRFDEGCVIDRPFDLEPFRRAAAARSRDDDEFRLLTVTNLRYEEKARGVRTVLRGIEPLFDAHEELRFAVAGAGRAFDSLASFVEAYPHADRVDLLGFRSDVPSLLANADLFVYVSFLDSLAMTVLEAQAAGLPVVCGGTMGVPEAAGAAGYLCPPTPAGVEHAVGELLRDPARRREVAAASESRMADYDERAATAYVDLWASLL